MQILFIHQNFPGQYRHLASALASDPGNHVVAMHMRPDLQQLPGIRTVCSGLSRSNTPGIHPWALEVETKIIRGETSWYTARKLQEEGFTPDLICAHHGWGESLFVKDVWPTAKLLSFFEYYYNFKGFDVGFDPEFKLREDEACRLRLKNIHHLLALEACDAGISPTKFQKSVHPREFHQKIHVIHDGIDTDVVTPNHAISINLEKAGVALTRQDEVITFVNRNLEPGRGWHIFARAMPEIQRRRPKAHILIIGGDGVSYGSQPENGVSYKQTYLAEVAQQLDMRRVHFLGMLPYQQFIAVLQLSSVHIYLTIPFVLSWSMLEAMSAGCLVIGSRTPPVEEVIRHGENGLLVDFFAPDEIADAITEVLAHPDRMQAIRTRARETVVERYDLKKVCLPGQLNLIQQLTKQ
jgi:glycosyltransferase involved in cell wall biosynthesis